MTLVFDDGGETTRKTTENSDTVDGQFVDVVRPERIDQRFTFVSDDPQFAGTMLMRWRFEEEPGGTRVTLSAENVPEGIKPEDHQAGMLSSLANLASYVEERRTSAP